MATRDRGYWDPIRKAYSNEIGSPIQRQPTYKNNSGIGETTFYDEESMPRSNPQTNQSQKANTMGILDNSYTMSEEDMYKNYFQRPNNKNKFDLRRAAGMVLNQDNQDDNYFGNVGGMHYGNPEFEWGMNMPTFNLVKGGLDTLGGLTNTWMNFKKFGLLEDQAKYEREMGDKKYANDLVLGNNQIANANFNIDERNAFKKAYGGADGNYLMQDHLKSIG